MIWQAYTGHVPNEKWLNILRSASLGYLLSNLSVLKTQFLMSKIAVNSYKNFSHSFIKMHIIISETKNQKTIIYIKALLCAFAKEAGFIKPF